MKLTREQTYVNLGLSGVACSIAQFVVHPVETAMVRQQLTPGGVAVRGFGSTLGLIASKEGMTGLYRGITAATLREMSYSTLRFGLYEPLRDVMHDDPQSNAALLGDRFTTVVRVCKRMLSGCLAGGIASAIASPTDMVKISMQSDKAMPVPDMTHYLREISGRPGGPIKPFYEGVSATITRAVVLGATKMVVYNEVKESLKRSPDAPSPALRPTSWQRVVPWSYGWRDVDFEKYGHPSAPSTPQRLLLVFNTSVITGLAVTFTTSAFTNARTHIMAHPGKYSGMGHALVDIVRQHGPLGLYRGFVAQWARFGPYATVQFLAWEQLRFMCQLPSL